MLMERPGHPQSEIEPPHRVSPSRAAAPDGLHMPPRGPACGGTGNHHLTSGVWGESNGTSLSQDISEGKYSENNKENNKNFPEIFYNSLIKKKKKKYILRSMKMGKNGEKSEKHGKKVKSMEKPHSSSQPFCSSNPHPLITAI